MEVYKIVKWTDKFGSLEVYKIVNALISLEGWRFAKLQMDWSVWKFGSLKFYKIVKWTDKFGSLGLYKIVKLTDKFESLEVYKIVNGLISLEVCKSGSLQNCKMDW